LNRLFYLIILAFLPLLIINGQVADKGRIVQVTGIVSDEESNPVPGVSVISHKLKKGTISELSGIYNIISIPGDTIWISALGYKNNSFTVPQNIDSKQFTKDIKLLNDTIAIKDVVILPWKNYEEFKREVLADRIIKPEILNMYENLASIQQSIANTYNYSISPEAGYRMAMQQTANALYSRNQSPVNNLLNPFAWAKFFNDIKHGLFKNEKFNKTKSTKTKLVKAKKKETTDKDE
jgi:CarboxypepD_reg-like domain